MRQWKSLAALQAAAPSCFPSPSPPREEGQKRPRPGGREEEAPAAAVRLVDCDGRVRAYRPPVTARELMRQHPRHLVCRADALLVGERIPAVAPAEELRPGQAYFLLPAHMFRSALSFVSLASTLLLLLSSSSSAGGKRPGRRPFELCRTASGTLQVKFSDDFLADEPAAEEEREEKEKPRPAVLRGDERLEKEYEGLVGYGKARRWAPKLEPIQEAVVIVSAADSTSAARRKSRGLPFLGRLGSRRRRRAALPCNGGGGAVACSG